MTEEAYEPESQCLHGRHDFELLPVTAAGEFGILLGHSRCRHCEVVADDWYVEPLSKEFWPALPAVEEQVRG